MAAEWAEQKEASQALERTRRARRDHGGGADTAPAGVRSTHRGTATLG